MTGNKPDAKRAPQAERAARLAAELRANLKRRKAQARGRQAEKDTAGDAPSEAEPPAGSDDKPN